MNIAIYNITLTNEYTSEEKSFKRYFPAKIKRLDVFEILDAEFNTENRTKQLPLFLISASKESPYDYPIGHWYRDQSININYHTR